MRTLITPLFLLAACIASSERSRVDDTVALVDVSVIDGTGSPAQHRQTVIIVDGLIAAIGPTDSTSIPADADIRRMPGRTVIPGLIGMHDHTHMPGITFMGYSASRLWLASGVTTVQTAGSADPNAELELAAAVARGDSIGPRIFPTAPYITGPGGNGPMYKPESAESARAFVRRWSEAGATWFKLYRHTEPAIAAAVIDEAHQLGRKVTAHLCSMTFREAAEMGIDSIEHGLITTADFLPDREPGQCASTRSAAAILNLNDPRVDSLIRFLVESDVTLTSTLAIIESHFPHRPQADHRSLDLMSDDYRLRYDERQNSLAQNVATTTMTPALFRKFMEFERMFVAAGGRLVMGPDPGRHVLPGYGNQRGFELLVEAGFTVPDAVRIATLNGAQALGLDDKVGRLAPGFIADVVVLNGDLERDSAAIRNVEIVFRGGVSYDPIPLIDEVRGQIGIR